MSGFRNIILAGLWVGMVSSGGDCLWANVISISPTSLNALSTTGVSFEYVGTLTQNDEIGLTVTGDPCLQTGPGYCVNGAGVVAVAGTTPVGGASTFTGPVAGVSGTWDYGALVMEISGTNTAVQLFPADAADGLGSGSPPLSLTLPLTTLSELGFSPLNELDPTITFVMADDLYTDNSGHFNLAPVPEPTTVGVVGVLVCGLAGVLASKRRRDSAAHGPYAR